jgi:hypothetical protein
MRARKGRVVIDSIEEIQCESIKEFWRAPRAEIRYIPTVPRTVMAMYDKRELFVFTKPTPNNRVSCSMVIPQPRSYGR